MKLHIVEMHPCKSHELDSSIDWQLMSLSDADAELKTLERTLGGATKVRTNDVPIDEDDWSDWIDTLIPRLSPRASDAVLAMGPISELHRVALFARVAQARRALKFAASAVIAGECSTTTALLPKTWPTRFRLLIGNGSLPIAWVMHVDVPRC